MYAVVPLWSSFGTPLDISDGWASIHFFSQETLILYTSAWSHCFTPGTLSLECLLSITFVSRQFKQGPGAPILLNANRTRHRTRLATGSLQWFWKASDSLRRFLFFLPPIHLTCPSMSVEPRSSSSANFLIPIMLILTVVRLHVLGA